MQQAATAKTELDELPGDSVTHNTWGKCQSVIDLKFSSPHAGVVFATPSTLQKDNEKAKWAAECAKIQPWLLVLEKALSGDASAKLTEQTIKSAITSAKKVNSKVDKRVYPEEKNGDKLFSVRAQKLRAALEAVKDMRTMVFSSLKVTAIDRKGLEAAIKKVEDPFQELDENKKWVAFPLHWIQACVSGAGQFTLFGSVLHLLDSRLQVTLSEVGCRLRAVFN